MKMFGLRLVVLCAFLTSCATLEVPDFRGYVVLPASGSCFGINVVSGLETEIPSVQCEDIVKRSIHIDSENWKVLRASIQRNCQHFQCTQLVGAFDGLFLALDQALDTIPTP